MENFRKVAIYSMLSGGGAVYGYNQLHGLLCGLGTGASTLENAATHAAETQAIRDFYEHEQDWSNSPLSKVQHMAEKIKSDIKEGFAEIVSAGIGDDGDLRVTFKFFTERDDIEEDRDLLGCEIALAIIQMME